MINQAEFQIITDIIFAESHAVTEIRNPAGIALPSRQPINQCAVTVNHDITGGVNKTFGAEGVSTVAVLIQPDKSKPVSEFRRIAECSGYSRVSLLIQIAPALISISTEIDRCQAFTVSSDIGILRFDNDCSARIGNPVLAISRGNDDHSFIDEIITVETIGNQRIIIPAADRGNAFRQCRLNRSGFINNLPDCRITACSD
ncbi:hypothetical protein SDC9_159517 [bioreactor metagenome]|uniref:Uncharacterized protein n=1 Tax=bioreactor metagenome TaxID=1076179 RepID=A0A645FCT8_9ZZZZ